MSTSSKVIITCAVNGSIQTPTMSPYLPVTAEGLPTLRLAWPRWASRSYLRWPRLHSFRWGMHQAFGHKNVRIGALSDQSGSMPI